MRALRHRPLRPRPARRHRRWPTGPRQRHNLRRSLHPFGGRSSGGAISRRATPHRRGSVLRSRPRTSLPSFEAVRTGVLWYDWYAGLQLPKMLPCRGFGRFFLASGQKWVRPLGMPCVAHGVALLLYSRPWCVFLLLFSSRVLYVASHGINSNCPITCQIVRELNLLSVASDRQVGTNAVELTSPMLLIGAFLKKPSSVCRLPSQRSRDHLPQRPHASFPPRDPLPLDDQYCRQ